MWFVAEVFLQCPEVNYRVVCLVGMMGEQVDRSVHLIQNLQVNYLAPNQYSVSVRVSDHAVK